MRLTKVVNGSRVTVSQKEEKEIHDLWAYNEEKNKRREERLQREKERITLRETILDARAAGIEPDTDLVARYRELSNI